MIRVSHLVKRFGTTEAVADVSFEIADGETFGLLGPNGAGKTTTISLMTGLLRPDAGEIDVGGQRDPSRAEVRRCLGVAPQSLALYEDLSASENLSFFGRLYGLGGARLTERVDWALEFAGLTDRRRDRVATYSGGMKRRLNIACALVHEPTVILLDEPTVGVDPQSRNSIFESIEKLRRGGRTVLYTTHYMEEVQRLCDRVAILDHGKVLALDRVDALIAAHGGVSVVEAEFASPPTDLGPLQASVKGNHLRFESDNPLEAVARISGAGRRLVSLKVDQPTLEDVFLHLTGRKLRD